MRPTDLMPKPLIEELVRLGKIDRDWVQWRWLPGSRYANWPRQATWLSGITKLGAVDWFGFKAMAAWLIDGPKVFKPTPEQCQALEQVSVNLTLADYTQPFPALAVQLNYPPFHAAVVYNEPGLLLACLHTPGNEEDIVTTIGTEEGEIEDSLVRSDPTCSEFSPAAHKALRVAVNSCLALSHFGHHMGYLFPKEVEDDTRLARENTPRGERARWRLPLAVFKVTFSQEVVLHRTEYRRREPGEPTGREMPPHFRRGHWAMVACGPQHSERKRTFRPGVFVRPDLFVGEKHETITTYEAK